MLLSTGAKNVFLKMGEKGLIYANEKEMYSIEAAKVDRVVSVNGAGDSLVGGIISKLVEEEKSTIFDCISHGLWCAKLTLESEETISPKITTGMEKPTNLTFLRFPPPKVN